MSHNRTATTQMNGHVPGQTENTEVILKATRRMFSDRYKLRILQEADKCAERGEIGALLRREGLHSSNLTTWRRQRENGELGGPARNPGSKATKAAELAELRQENELLRRRLTQAERVIDAQKKFVSAFESLTQLSGENS